MASHRSGRTLIVGALRLLFALCLLLVSRSLMAEEPKPGVEYAIVLHGGALDDPQEMSADLRAGYEAGLKKALETGKAILERWEDEQGRPRWAWHPTSRPNEPRRASFEELFPDTGTG